MSFIPHPNTPAPGDESVSQQFGGFSLALTASAEVGAELGRHAETPNCCIWIHLQGWGAGGEGNEAHPSSGVPEDPVVIRKCTALRYKPNPTAALSVMRAIVWPICLTRLISVVIWEEKVIFEIPLETWFPVIGCLSPSLPLSAPYALSLLLQAAPGWGLLLLRPWGLPRPSALFLLCSQGAPSPAQSSSALRPPGQASQLEGKQQSQLRCSRALRL